MVAVVPSFNRGGSLGKAIGAGMQGLVPMANQQYQRNLTQQGLSDVENYIKSNPNASPLQLQLQIGKAFAGTEGGHKYASVFPELALRERAYSQQQNRPAPGQGSKIQTESAPGQFSLDESSDQPQTDIPLQAYDNQIQSIDTQLSQMGIPQPSAMQEGGNLGKTSLGSGPIPETYSPQEYDMYEKQSLANGIDPKPGLAAMHARDQIARARLNDVVEGAKVNESIAKLNIERENNFIKKAQDLFSDLKGEKLDTFMSVKLPAEDMAKGEFQQIKARKRIADTIEKGRRSVIENGRKAWLNGRFEEGFKADKNAVKAMVDAGQTPLAKQTLAEAGYGPVYQEKAVNDLSPEIYSKIENLPKIDSGALAYGGPGAGKFTQERTQKQLEKYEDFIAKNVLPGRADARNPDIFKPGTPLLVLRQQMMNKGISYTQFSNILNKLHDEGKIKLDDYQKSDLPDISRNPIKSVGIFEALMSFIPGYVQKE